MDTIKETTTKQALLAGLFWGAVWGGVEATFGFLLHFLPVPGFAGSLMFPVGAFCLLAARERGGLRAMAAVPLVAAGLKLLDLFLPGQAVASVLHPAASILLQGAVLTVAAGSIARSVFHAAGASLAWKGAFLLLLASGLTGHSGFLAAPAGRFFLFLGVFTVIEAALVIFALRRGEGVRGYAPRPFPALAALAAAAGLQLLTAGLA